MCGEETWRPASHPPRTCHIRRGPPPGLTQDYGMAAGVCRTRRSRQTPSAHASAAFSERRREQPPCGTIPRRDSLVRDGLLEEAQAHVVRRPRVGIGGRIITMKFKPVGPVVVVLVPSTAHLVHHAWLRHLEAPRVREKLRGVTQMATVDEVGSSAIGVCNRARIRHDVRDVHASATPHER
eukprot:scaffold77655_cov64-Phaeocystis_antarctica.AAC.3